MSAGQTLVVERWIRREEDRELWHFYPELPGQSLCGRTEVAFGERVYSSINGPEPLFGPLCRRCESALKKRAGG